MSGVQIGNKMRIVIPGQPITKKNSPRIARARNGRTYILPSDRFQQYQEFARFYIPVRDRKKLDVPLNVKCVYYMPTHRLVDLVNLLEATCDILVHYGVISDDNSQIVVSHDGSRVLYDKDNPRTEIELAEIEGE